MTHFEYLAAGASILFALTLGRTLTAAPYLFKKGVFDPLFTFHYCVFFLWQLGLWWTLWENSSVQTWEFPGFVLFIATPLAYYLASLFLVPNDPHTVVSWKAHYESVSRAFSGLFAFTFVIGISRVLYLQPDFPWTGVTFSFPFFLAAVVGAFTKNRLYHWFLGLTLLMFIGFRIAASGTGGA